MTQISPGNICTDVRGESVLTPVFWLVLHVITANRIDNAWPQKKLRTSQKHNLTSQKYLL
jgi:hypothetical protein